MDPEKRNLIVREIEHWRRSRLLPEQYCDFLLNLYLERPAGKRVLGVPVRAIADSHWKMWMIAFGLLAIASFFILHFNSFPIYLQIGIAAAFVLGCYVLGFWKREKLPSVSYGLIGSGSALLIGLGVYLLKKYGLDDPSLLIAYVAFCSFVWLSVGVVARMGLFHFCGWLGLVLVYASLLAGYAGPFDPVATQISWLPFCVAFGWLGWLSHRRSKRAGSVFLAMCAVLWVMPELFGYFVLADDALLTFMLMVKIMLAGAILFAFRKTWIGWVA
mgnify:CR=1 FL=1